MSFDVHIIGGGLAGSEAAWQLAEAGIPVRLSEMRGGGDSTPAHETDRLAEMVCSNSVRSADQFRLNFKILDRETHTKSEIVWGFHGDAKPVSARAFRGRRPSD